jgi:hypothetical protein
VEIAASRFKMLQRVRKMDRTGNKKKPKRKKNQNKSRAIIKLNETTII